MVKSEEIADQKFGANGTKIKTLKLEMDGGRHIDICEEKELKSIALIAGRALHGPQFPGLAQSDRREALARFLNASPPPPNCFYLW